MSLVGAGGLHDETFPALDRIPPHGLGYYSRYTRVVDALSVLRMEPVVSDSTERITQPIAVLVRPGVARVTVLSGPSSVGASFVLASGTLKFGGGDADVDLSSDPSIAAEQAVLRNEDGAVTLECALNNQVVFLRRRGSAPLEIGDHFLVANQRLRVVPIDDDRPHHWTDGTQLFTSPRRQGTFAVQQILKGGRLGASASMSTDVVAIGAAGNTLVLSHDPSVSQTHAVVQRGDDDTLSIVDLGSLNGVFTKVNGREALESGDLFWIGEQLIRLEITA